ncbi:hypothetical protein B0T11DRAFT_211792, partial [Plectosphaerella cucumerina]
GASWLYGIRYLIKFGYFFAVVTRRHGHGGPMMIRAITRKDNGEHLERFCYLCHPNIVKGVEVYSCPVGGRLLISEFIPTSLRYLCVALIYPYEASSLSADHFKVLSGLSFRLDNGLVYEEVSVGNVL